MGLGPGQIANDQDFRTAGQGVLAAHKRETAISGVGATEVGFIRIDNIPVRNGYDYEIICTPINITTSTITSAVGMTRVRASTSGSATTSSTSIGYQRMDQTVSTSQTNVTNIIAMFTATADGTASFLITVARVLGAGTVGLFASAGDYVKMTVKETGPTPAATGVDV